MLTILIALMVGGAAGWSAHYGGLALVWSITSGVGGAIVMQALGGLLLRKQIEKRTNTIQAIIMDGQERLTRKVRVLQQKPQGGLKQMQRMLERDQRVFIERALEQTAALEPFYPWSFFLKQQVNTMRMQFHYQLKNFEEVDKLLPGCMYMEPMAVAMRMVRMYKNEDPKLADFFKKKVRKFKLDKSTILYALYSWILVKRGEIDEAYDVLTEAKEKTEDETLIRNWEHLANKRVRNFSNAGLGEEWYALGVEEPKQKIVRQKQRKPGRRPF